MREEFIMHMFDMEVKVQKQEILFTLKTALESIQKRQLDTIFIFLF